MDIDVEKLKKVAMLAQRSENDGEQLSAFRTLLRMLDEAGASFTDVLEKGVSANLNGALVKDAGNGFGSFGDIFAAASASAFGAGGAFAKAKPQPQPARPHREVTLLTGELPARFTGRFEILSVGQTRAAKKPMAQVKVIIERDAGDLADNVTRIAFTNVFGDMALTLQDLQQHVCAMTSRPGTKPYPDTLTSIKKAH